MENGRVYSAGLWSVIQCDGGKIDGLFLSGICRTHFFMCYGRQRAGRTDKKAFGIDSCCSVIFVLCNAVSGGKLMSIGKNAITNESTADKENAAGHRMHRQNHRVQPVFSD